jgi:hypothetical protein
MTLVVTFRFRSESEVHKRLASSLKIDGQGALILYDKNRGILENLTISEIERSLHRARPQPGSSQRLLTSHGV